MKAEILVVGGGVIGSSIALYLRRHPRAGRVVVVEPDPAYALASTPRASGGFRRLFSTPENIQMSQYSIGFFDNFEKEVPVNGQAPGLQIKRQGYLFIVQPEFLPTLEASHRTQSALGVNVQLLDRAALKSLFPSLETDDIGAALYSPDDGWLDPNSLLQGIKKKAQDLGAAYVQDRVVAIGSSQGLARSASLESGQCIQADIIVNAAGAWAQQVSAMAGMPLPVFPMRRFDHYFECKASIEPLPYIKDPARLAMRPEGRGFTAGIPNWNEPRGFNFDVDHDYFENVVWPAIAHRVPSFEAVKLKSSWSGLYDQNALDTNMILGPWLGGLSNFYVAAGFSGHGLMHAPAVGRAMAELILDGDYQTLDLSNMSYKRIIEQTPYAEKGII
ncbi:NAD(P)/FAD-dependent oxidoreductase [Paralcaligenes ginsengisoli]